LLYLAMNRFASDRHASPLRFRHTKLVRLAIQSSAQPSGARQIAEGNPQGEAGQAESTPFARAPHSRERGPHRSFCPPISAFSKKNSVRLANFRFAPPLRQASQSKTRTRKTEPEQTPPQTQFVWPNYTSAPTRATIRFDQIKPKSPSRYTSLCILRIPYKLKRGSIS
jgi:hypothetical protein